MNKKYVAPSSKTVEVFTTTGILATSNIEMGGDTDEFDTQHLRPRDSWYDTPFEEDNFNE